MSVTAVSVRGKPYWQVSIWRDGGEYRRRKYLDRRAHLKRDAIALERELIDEYEASKEGGKHQGPGEPTSTVSVDEVAYSIRDEGRASAATTAVDANSAMRFDAFAERYLAVQDPRKSDYKNKTRNLRQHLVPFFGATPLDQVSRMLIDEFKVKLRSPSGPGATSRRSRNRKEPPVSRRRRGAAKSPKTINNILGTLRAVLNLASDYDLLDRVPRIKFESTTKVDPGFLDFGEAEKFIAAAASGWELFVMFAIRTGLRRSEMFELRWKDLHLEVGRPYVRVARSVRANSEGKLEVKATKGKRPRSVPLTQRIAAVLKVHRPVNAGDEDLVFPAENGGYLNHTRMYRAVVNTAERAGLKHVHPHLLRHTFASHCYMRGVPPQVVQKWMGHASVSTTERYAHLRPDTGDELIEELERGALDATANATANTRGRGSKNAV